MLSVTSAAERSLVAAGPTCMESASRLYAWKLSVCSNRAATIMEWPLCPRCGVQQVDTEAEMGFARTWAGVGPTGF